MPGAAVAVRRKMGRSRFGWLMAATVVYVLFCVMVYGRCTGLLPGVAIEDVFIQRGLDTGVIVELANIAIALALAGGILFNLVTAAWIWLRLGFWQWCITVVVAFCAVCSLAGLIVGVPPLLSLFAGCCGIMALVGWAFGLTYVQFCVIGNIWVPCTAVIAASGYLVYAAVRRFGAVSAAWKVVRVLAVGAAAVQIAAMVMLLCHYAGTFDYAFYECVKDLKMIAEMFDTTYVIVNLVIYILLGVLLLALDIIAARLLRRQA